MIPYSITRGQWVETLKIRFISYCSYFSAPWLVWRLSLLPTRRIHRPHPYQGPACCLVEARWRIAAQSRTQTWQSRPDPNYCAIPCCVRLALGKLQSLRDTRLAWPRSRGSCPEVVLSPGVLALGLYRTLYVGIAAWAGRDGKGFTGLRQYNVYWLLSKWWYKM